MKRYYVVPCISEEIDWSTVPTLSVDEYLWGTRPGIQMQAQACYDEDRLYLHMTAVEQNIRAEYSAPLSMVCEDSCMEFFFSPLSHDDRYINFEINPNGCTFIGIGTGQRDNTRICPAYEEEIFCKCCAVWEGGWEASCSIPVSFIRIFFPEFALRAGHIIRANFYKCGELTKEPHYISWNPVSSMLPDFHRPQDFGQLVLANR